MVESKAWDWEKVKGSYREYWQEPSMGSYYLVHRWWSQGKKDFLDLGCGLGRHTIQFAEAGFNTSGFDLSENSIEKTREYAEKAGVKVDLKVGDMLHLPYGGASFDCIYCYNVISHTDTKGAYAMAEELKRVLKPGGECYLTLCSKQSWGFQQDWPLLDKNTKPRLVEGPEYGVPHFYADYELILDIYKDFEIVQVFQLEDHITPGEVSSFHFHVLIRKR